jgi:hypothetical protein
LIPIRISTETRKGRDAPKDSPGPRSLLLDVGNVGPVPLRCLLEPNAELVLLEDPKPLQLRGDELQGIEFACPALLLVHLSSKS